MVKNNNQPNKSYQYPLEDKEILAKMKHPNYDGGSFALSPQASSLEKAKYEICRNIIRYKREHDLTQEEIAERIQLGFAETKRILRYRINEFTLDRLITYTDNLHIPLEIKITNQTIKHNL